MHQTIRTSTYKKQLKKRYITKSEELYIRILYIKKEVTLEDKLTFHSYKLSCVHIFKKAMNFTNPHEYGGLIPI